MIEEKITILNNINELLPQEDILDSEKSRERTHIYTGILNSEASLNLDMIDMNIIPSFKDYVYNNISDLCKFNFLLGEFL